MSSIAHTSNRLGKRQDLLEHLRNVADITSGYCDSFGAAQFAYYAGLLHDIGKYDPAFQQYLLNAEGNTTKHSRGPDHKGAGTVLAAKSEMEGLLAFLVAGHHGGLPSQSDLPSYIREHMIRKPVQDAIVTAKNTLPELRDFPKNLIPTHIRSELEKEFFTRMVFSALVDADFLDTEEHFNTGKRPERDNQWTLTN